MIGWNPSYNWTRPEFTRAVNNAFIRDQKQSVHLDVEHSDRKNMNDIKMWASQMGYQASEACGGDVIVISREA